LAVLLLLEAIFGGTKHGHYKERIKQFDQQVLSFAFYKYQPRKLSKDSKLKSMRK
jgi:hypothetical protein